MQMPTGIIPASNHRVPTGLPVAPSYSNVGTMRPIPTATIPASNRLYPTMDPGYSNVRMMQPMPTGINWQSNRPGVVPTGYPVRYLPHPHPHNQFHNRYRMGPCHKASFLRRVHIALMTLGTWEGRAVAFVLGCGLGVLFRMLWVLGVVSYRLIRGPNQENRYSEIILVEEYEDEEEGAATVVPPPPVYTDEKADKDKVTAEESK